MAFFIEFHPGFFIDAGEPDGNHENHDRRNDQESIVPQRQPKLVKQDDLAIRDHNPMDHIDSVQIAGNH